MFTHYPWDGILWSWRAKTLHLQLQVLGGDLCMVREIV